MFGYNVLGFGSFANRASGFHLWRWGNVGGGNRGDGLAFTANTSLMVSSPTLIDDPIDLPYEYGDGPLGGVVNQDKISTGNQTVHAIVEGKLFGWGNNTNGAIGKGDVAEASSPVQIGDGEDWECITEAEASCLAIRGGKLFSWGINSNGQLGDGTVITRSSPVQIGSSTNWTAVGNSAANGWALNSNGEQYVWGSNANGRLGDGTVIARSSPVQVAGTDWKGWAFGSGSCCYFLKTNGTLFVCGEQNTGSFGNGAAADQTSSPIQIGSDTDWAEIRTCATGTIAMKTNGTIWTWGGGASGAGGHGDVINRSVPTQVGSSTTWISIGTATGENACWAVDAGVLFFWGDQNTTGGGGIGINVNDCSSPIAVAGGFTDWVFATASANTALGLRRGDS